MTIENLKNEMSFAPDLSVIDIAAWLRIRENDWEPPFEFDMDEDFLIEEDAA